MDISKDTDIPVILGRPFMLTASCIVDMEKRKLELGFEDQKIDFDLFSLLKLSVNFYVVEGFFLFFFFF